MGTIAPTPVVRGSRRACTRVRRRRGAVPRPRRTLAETLRLRFRARDFRVVRLGVRIGRLLDVVAELRRLVRVLASGGGGGGFIRVVLRFVHQTTDFVVVLRASSLRGRARTFSRTLTLTARVRIFRRRGGA